MESRFIVEAYKPAEKLAFNYLILRDILSKLLKEQKFPADIESALLKIYKNFQLNSSKLIALYEKIPNVLNLDKLLDDVESEVDAIFIDSGLDQPLLEEDEAVQNLQRFIIDVNFSFLEDSEKYKDAIPGFNWDIDSFKNAFNQIEERGEKYVNSSDNEQIRSAGEKI